MHARFIVSSVYGVFTMQTGWFSWGQLNLKSNDCGCVFKTQALSAFLSYVYIYFIYVCKSGVWIKIPSLVNGI